MASGIGDAETLTTLHQAGRLDDLEISDWINNTAVGAGLFDNPNTFIELRSPNVTSYTYSYDNPVAADKQLYLDTRSGPYSFASQTSVFWRYAQHDDGSVTGLQGTIDSSGYSDFTDEHTITLNIYGTSGLKSVGRVVLDENFIAKPTDNVYYSDPQDAADIAAFIRELFDALPSEGSEGAGLTPLNIAQNATVEEISAYVTTMSDYAKGSVNHWSSSCRLESCVDGEAKVVGMDNLYVVDGSIVPPLTVNPQMGIMIAAERASEFILGAWSA
ncbi:uncharacterized protein BCR38DRAFT_441756 [Pseudomassariella vexata]|uniref:Glucose-methanol-choline oxidoreductase C-terminal domain-containing protein n=1 Tax=Pseudomassariella vexata TaxID=1141098 RepID=A0A1Y2DN77_9PEZI|nr:uncharacterized protein BCR38DRAFT_441756 [Pseudomassariella vexata]ORY60629.1 hypothetical protein BCR38DRAFT_441756 [Pseudomassariella vexata]